MWGKKPSREYDGSLQERLIAVTKDTTSLSNEIAGVLKDGPRDYLKQVEVASSILNDAVVVIDETGIIQAFNPSAEKIFGWTAQEVIGVSVSILFRHLPEEPVTTSSVMDVLTNEGCFSYDIDGTPLNGLVGLTKSGSTFFIDVTVSSFPRKTGDTDHVLTIRDVGDFVKAQKMLSEGETHYRTVFDHSPDGIAIIACGEVIDLNTTMAGLISCGDFMSIFHEGDHDKILLALDDHQQGSDTIYDFRVSIHGTDMLVSMVPVDTVKKTPATIMTLRDLSCTR